MVGFSGQVSATHDYKLGINIRPIGGGGNTGLPASFGVMGINPGGFAAKAGLKEFDHIVGYDGKRFARSHMDSWREVFTQSKRHHLIEMEIKRKGQYMTLIVDVRTNEEKEYHRLEARVGKLESDYLKQGEIILSEVNDDYSNVVSLEKKLEVVEKDNAEYQKLTPKEKEYLRLEKEYHRLEDRVGKLESDYKTQGTIILSQSNDDYSNLDLLEKNLEIVEEEYADHLVIVEKEKKLRAEKEQVFSKLKVRVEKLEGDFKDQGD